MTLRIIFMGTPDFAVPTLAEIIGQGHEVVACYTREPKPAGRGLEPQLSPVHRQAQLFGIPVFTPKSLRTEEAVAQFAAHDADVAVVVAYGMILPPSILQIPREGCLNLHGSLLPRWRGAAPIHRAIMAGDTHSGVMVMRMDEGLDTGAVAMGESCAITPNMTTGELHDKLMRLGADLMGRALAALSRGALNAKPQIEAGTTYAAKITKQEARIDWSLPAIQVHNHIRGLSPFPGAFFEVDLGGSLTRVKVLQSRVVDKNGEAGTVLEGLTIACGQEAVELMKVQRAGKSAMSMDEFLKGNKLFPNQKLS
jgi:methionyl-tRNA formyltransferase